MQAPTGLVRAAMSSAALHGHIRMQMILGEFNSLDGVLRFPGGRVVCASC